MDDRAKFLAVFLSSALVMKAVGELVHELMGHGLFVLIFGGRITRVHISLLWPYELSHIWFSGSFDVGQLIWIHGGGILVCLAASSMLQALLLVGRVTDWRLGILLFWLSFWTFINPSGYLIVGGVRPFGDVERLIDYGVLSQATSMALGMVVFLSSFLSLSRIFRDLLIDTGLTGSEREMRIYLATLWLIVPLVTVMAATGLGFPGSDALIFLSVSLMPSLTILLLPKLVIMGKQ